MIVFFLVCNFSHNARTIWVVVEDGYEFFGDRTLVTVFSAPNYCGEFDNCGAMMSVDADLMCSFQVLKPVDTAGQRWGSNRPGTPPRNRKG